MSEQLQMFEPEGKKLAELVHVHTKAANFERVVALNLICSGFTSAAYSRGAIAAAREQDAFVCEMALQFETLAGLV